MSILQKWPPYKLHTEMPEDSENASLLAGDVLGICGCWPLLVQNRITYADNL